MFALFGIAMFVVEITSFALKIVTVAAEIALKIAVIEIAIWLSKLQRSRLTFDNATFEYSGYLSPESGKIRLSGSIRNPVKFNLTFTG